MWSRPFSSTAKRFGRAVDATMEFVRSSIDRDDAEDYLTVKVLAQVRLNRPDDRRRRSRAASWFRLSDHDDHHARPSLQGRGTRAPLHVDSFDEFFMRMTDRSAGCMKWRSVG